MSQARALLLDLNRQEMFSAPMKRRVVELDGLRGLAVSMVVLSHAQASLPLGYSGWLTPLGFFSDGELGVRIFFVLSGFLITRILLAEYDRTGTISLPDFYKRRILRIFPAFYTYLLFVTILAFCGILQVAGESLLFSAIHLLNYIVGISLILGMGIPLDPGYPIIGHFWTLSLEEQFYWIWPLALIFIQKKKAFFIVPILLVVIPMLRVATYFLFPDVRGQLGMMFHTGADLILFGCWLAICFVRQPRSTRLLVLPPWAATALIVCTLFLLPRIELIVPSRLFHNVWEAINYSVFSFFITVIVANILLQPEAWYSRILKMRFLVFLGTISFSLYLWQQIFFFTTNTTFFWRFPINILCAVAAGWLSYRLIERPFLLVKNRRYSHQEAVPEMNVSAK